MHQGGAVYFICALGSLCMSSTYCMKLQGFWQEIQGVVAQMAVGLQSVLVNDTSYRGWFVCRASLDPALCLEAVPAFSHGRLTTRTRKPSLTTVRVLLGAGEAEERLRMEQLQRAKQRMVRVASCHELCSIG